MTTGQDNATATLDPGPTPNPVQRIIGVIFSPDVTMASIAKRPDWVLPLVLLLITSLAAGIIIAQHVDFVSATREAMEQNKNMTPEQVDRALKFTAAIGKVLTYLSPVLSLIGLLVIAGVLLLAFRLFGGEGDIKQAFSVTCYASVPSIIKSVITLIVMLARGGIVPVQQMATLIRTNLGFLADMKVNPMAFALYSSFDIFSVWFLALMIIGFAYVSRLSKAKSAGIIISLWFVVLLLKLIGPALQAISAK
jgi:hypothetical protein